MELAAIFTATPAEIDTELAALQYKLDELHRAIDRNAHRMDQTKSEHSLNVIETIIHDLRGKSHLVNDLIVALEKEYRRRGGWMRVFAVNNSNGHFHRTRRCRNTYDTTDWVWMPELSGLTNAEVVDRTGKMSCLTCFAGQREEIEKGREATVFTPAQAKAREEQAAAAEKKAAKAKIAAEKGITAPDGSPLFEVRSDDKGGFRTTTYVIKTEVSARRHAMTAAFDLFFYNVKHPASEGRVHPQTAAWEETVRTCTEAVAAKTGETVESLRAEIDKKVEAKYRREYPNSVPNSRN
jgi:hypothetical protein